MNDNVVFYIDDLPIKSNLVMAPMDGLTDHPFREIIKRFKPGIIFSEFINAYDYLNNHPFFSQQIIYSEDQRPFAYQIFDNSPERILETAEYLADRKPDFIDINMGCSAKTVASRGAGAGLLKEPEKIIQIFQTLKKNIKIPITGKIRLGWDEENLNYLLISRLLEDNGCSMITVHGRTKKQGYKGEANWNAIAEVKKNVKIPVIANGDVNSTADIDRILELTNCDAVMIGRTALRNPWIFLHKDINEISFSERMDLIFEHLDLMIQFYGCRSGLILFRKYLKFYIDISSMSKEDRTTIYNLSSPDQLKMVVQKIMNSQVV
ncbi:MAG TPA: tRNA dihydrouridine synthase DusB [Anaerolineaceae bacterium]|nr:tRNA dihydrouridine synthase DusB [Anaerolineaceae bacterium]